MKNVTLVCHSFGGRVGIKLSAKYGYLIKNLILIDSAGIRPKRDFVYYLKIYRHKMLTKLKIRHEAGSNDYKKLRGTIRETFKNVVNEDLSPYLSKIKVKTLIIWGNKDKDTPIYMAKKLNKKISNSRLIVLKGCGHFAYVERHTLFCEIVEKYLADECDLLDNCSGIGHNRRNGIITIPDIKSK